MNAWLSPRFAAATALAILVGLAAWQLFHPVGLPMIVAAEVSAGTVKTGESAPLLTPLGDRGSFAEIEQRPLFAMTRRPPQVAPPQQAAIVQPKTLDHYTVLGIVVASTGAVALVKGGGSETLHLRTGQTLDGWKLEAIEPAKLVFSLADRRQELEFKIGKARQDQRAGKAAIGAAGQ